MQITERAAEVCSTSLTQAPAHKFIIRFRVPNPFRSYALYHWARRTPLLRCVLPLNRVDVTGTSTSWSSPRSMRPMISMFSPWEYFPAIVLSFGCVQPVQPSYLTTLFDCSQHGLTRDSQGLDHWLVHRPHWQQLSHLDNLQAKGSGHGCGVSWDAKFWTSQFLVSGLSMKYLKYQSTYWIHKYY